MTFKTDTDGVTDPEGFFASADSADIRGKGDERLDIGVLYSIAPCAAAGVFTKNAVKAAPVLDCERVLRVGGPIFGLVANSGNANACTGNQGISDSLSMLQTAESASGSPKDSFLVCSTGRIGDLLPMDKITPTVKSVASRALDGEKEGTKFSECILTSDTRKKTCTATFAVEGNTVTIGGAAKGAGMIQPNMATMLAFITTDIAAESTVLQDLLKESVKHSFNAITVDGDMSTNDTVLILANGLAGNQTIRHTAKDAISKASLALFQQALNLVCFALAKMLVKDGEGVSRFVTVRVAGAKTNQQADAAVRSVANSSLVKTSWLGGDPNWGRIIDALGYSDATVEENKVDIGYSAAGSSKILYSLKAGKPTRITFERLCRAVADPEFDLHVNLNLGKGKAVMYASDLTEEYVEFNKGDVTDPASLGG
ncbi:MAG TPA: arginine biosynthesis protein ArgJ [Verrucomicrobiales bacterium]|nr:arginine biosynthesis protein ArgJ [Verrucomicrobiales bacterium]